MALDATRLKTAISTALGLALAAPPLNAVAGPQLDALADAIASSVSTAVVAELLANGVALPTALVAPPGGGPVTGVGKIG